MHPIEPVELRGDLVAIEPMRVDHAAGVLAAADADEVFAWLPYPRPRTSSKRRSGSRARLPTGDANRRLPFAILDAGGPVIGSTSYWDFDAPTPYVEIGSTWLESRVVGNRPQCGGEAAADAHAFETRALSVWPFGPTSRTSDRSER